jgi:hypothetical protein
MPITVREERTPGHSPETFHVTLAKYDEDGSFVGSHSVVDGRQDDIDYAREWFAAQHPVADLDPNGPETVT